MSGSGPGYKHTVIITPYMHILIHHIPHMLRRHGSLRIFSGQGIILILSLLEVLWEVLTKLRRPNIHTGNSKSLFQ